MVTNHFKQMSTDPITKPNVTSLQTSTVQIKITSARYKETESNTH